MSPTRSTAAHASVAYFRIHGFSQQAVAEQARLKTRLEETLGAALPRLNANERIVLEAPEGIAVIVLANPPGALRLAWRVGADPALPLAVGLAHGAVRVAQGAQSAIYGDALATAEAMSRAATAGGACASRDFREALARSAPSLARQLAHAGSALDAQDRAIEMFRADRESCARRRRRFFAVAGGVAAGIVALGIAVRLAAPPPRPGTVASSSPTVPATAPAPPPAPIVPDRPATVTFDIRPAGEIYVNGALKGKSPPLKKIQLPAGTHQIEIRSGKHKPLATELVVAEGEELAVQHSFAQPQKGFWKGLIDKVK
jgi:hypothetical protein